MEILLILVHVFVCIVLIFVVLLQSGKAADLAGAFGGGGSQTALGSRGAVTVLAKATTICAVLFMLTSLGLALMGSRGSSSVLDSAKVPVPAAPAAPATPPADGGTAPPAAPTADGSTPAPQQAAPAAGQAAPGAGQAAPAGTAPAGDASSGNPPTSPKPGGGR